MKWRVFIVVLLAGLLSSSGVAGTPKKLLLIGQGPDGHPAETHEYMAGLKVLARCLKPVPDLEVTTVRADGAWREGPDLLDRADGVVLYLAEGARWIDAQADRRKAFDRLAARGGGLVALHWAIGTRDAAPIDRFLRLLGGCHGGPDRKYKVLEAEATVVDPGCEIARGISNFRVRDEFYYELKFIKPSDGIQPLLQVPIEGAKQTVCWAWERPQEGRSFGFSGLHFHDNWRLEPYRRLVSQGVLWTLKLPIPKDGMAVDVSESDLKLSDK